MTLRVYILGGLYDVGFRVHLRLYIWGFRFRVYLGLRLYCVLEGL